MGPRPEGFANEVDLRAAIASMVIAAAWLTWELKKPSTTLEDAEVEVPNLVRSQIEAAKYVAGINDNTCRAVIHQHLHLSEGIIAYGEPAS
jgi:hypothetical protein